MFSDAQQRYVASLVASNRKDYPYYIAYSDFRTSDYEDKYVPQIYIIFTKEKITSKDLYSYEVPKGVKYSLNLYNPSRSNLGARTTVTNYAGGVLNVPIYEFIYTNATFNSYSIQPDINQLYGGDFNAQMQTQSFLVVAACLTAMLFTILRIRR